MGRRENVIGRANVEDTPELEAYYRSLEGEALGALWTVANEIEPWYPQPKSVPVLWKWKKVEPYVRKAADLVSAEKAARRARRYACFEYRGIKNILVQALDLMPLPDEQLEIAWMHDARYARRPTGTYGKEAAHDTEG